MTVPNRSSRSDVLGSGTGNYGHGSIIRGGGSGAGVVSGKGESNSLRNSIGGDLGKRGVQGLDPEELKKAGNEHYKKGHFSDALSLYDRAISLSPTSASYRSNRAAALTGLGRLAEAVKECQEAVRLDPNYSRAHHRLASLFIR
jgi:tetratricopeptide (TPR) repeat protein